MTVLEADASRSLESAAAAAGRGDRLALAQVMDTVTPMVIRHCEARLAGNPAARRVAAQSCEEIADALQHGAGQSFWSLVYGITADNVDRTIRDRVC